MPRALSGFEPPTARQIEVLRFIATYVETSNYPPTIREICRQFGINSTQAGTDHIRALERRGLLHRKRGSIRAMAITERGQRCLEGAK